MPKNLALECGSTGTLLRIRSSEQHGREMCDLRRSKGKLNQLGNLEEFGVYTRV